MIDWTDSKVLFSPRGMAWVANTARADVISRVRTADDDILHGASCAGERTYAENGPMIDKRKFVFVPVFGVREWRFIRRPATKRGATGGAYDRLEVRRIIGEKELKPLDSVRAVHDASTAGQPISARMSVDAGSFDFPVRVVNTQVDRWQIDAGPVLLPAPDGACSINDLRIGYVVASSLRPEIHVMSETVTRGLLRPHTRRQAYAVNGTIELFGG